MASGKAWSDSAQEILSTLYNASSPAGSCIRMQPVGLESIKADASFVHADKGDRANDWQLRDQDIQVRIDRERVSRRQ